MTIIILKDEESFRKLSRDKLLSSKLVAFGMPDGRFSVCKNRTGGSMGIVSSGQLSQLITLSV